MDTPGRYKHPSSGWPSASLYPTRKLTNPSFGTCRTSKFHFNIPTIKFITINLTTTQPPTMAHHARIEEVSDSDPEEMDISDFAPPPSSSRAIIDPANIPATSQQREMLQPQARQRDAEAEREATKSWHTLYPVYFDGSRSRAEGRRVGKGLAVVNPLARELADAVASLGVKVTFDPGKTHPKDWGNPGRVKCNLKGQSTVKNSMLDGWWYGNWR